jgi:stress-induced morphogen
VCDTLLARHNGQWRIGSATGPGSIFDESPKEPVSDHQRQISEVLMASMEEKIKAALETDIVSVKDVYGDNQHVSIEVVSPLFEDKSAVQRQRMVYKVSFSYIMLPLTLILVMMTLATCACRETQMRHSCRQYGWSCRLLSTLSMT